MKLDDKTLEYIKVLSLGVIAISSVFIDLWLSQILQILDVLGETWAESQEHYPNY